MSIVILDLLEVFCQPNRSLPLGVHYDGVKNVIKLRGKRQLYSERGWGLFRLAHRRLACQNTYQTELECLTD
jgi:hypothetical protein